MTLAAWFQALALLEDQNYYCVPVKFWDDFRQVGCLTTKLDLI